MKPKNEPQASKDPQVAYHDGPPEIQFNGRAWRKGAAQTVTESEWKAMQARADCAGFQFQTVTKKE